jgi:hypothetical protein
MANSIAATKDRRRHVRYQRVEEVRDAVLNDVVLTSTGEFFDGPVPPRGAAACGALTDQPIFGDADRR